MEDNTKTNVINSLSIAWLYFSQVTSIIGLISIIDDLRSWISVATTISRFLQNNISVSIYSIVRYIFSCINDLVKIYRELVHPVVDWLTQWLPYPIPSTVKDIIIVAVFYFLGRTRIENVHLNKFIIEYNEPKKARKRNRIKDFGFNEIESKEVLDLIEFKKNKNSMMNYYNRKNNIPNYFLEQEKKLYQKEAFWGEKFSKAYDEINKMKFDDLDKIWKKSNNRENMLNIITSAVAFFAIFFIFLDILL